MPKYRLLIPQHGLQFVVSSPICGRDSHEVDPCRRWLVTKGDLGLDDTRNILDSHPAIASSRIPQTTVARFLCSGTTLAGFLKTRKPSHISGSLCRLVYILHTAILHVSSSKRPVSSTVLFVVAVVVVAELSLACKRQSMVQCRQLPTPRPCCCFLGWLRGPLLLLLLLFLLLLQCT